MVSSGNTVTQLLNKCRSQKFWQKLMLIVDFARTFKCGAWSEAFKTYPLAAKGKQQQCDAPREPPCLGHLKSYPAVPDSPTCL
eukprot:2541813-Amphidinium_carterae.1